MFVLINKTIKPRLSTTPLTILAKFIKIVLITRKLKNMKSKKKKDFPPGQLYRSSEKFDSMEFHNYQQQQGLIYYTFYFFIRKNKNYIKCLCLLTTYKYKYCFIFILKNFTKNYK